MKNILVMTLFILEMVAWAGAQQPGSAPERNSEQTTSPSPSNLKDEDTVLRNTKHAESLRVRKKNVFRDGSGSTSQLEEPEVEGLGH